MGFVLSFLLVLAILFLVLASVYLIVKEKLSRLARDVFGTSSIVEGFRKQEMELDMTPKSLSSMDSVEIPKILQDFPELNINEIKSMAETGLIKYYKCLDKGKYEEFYNGTKKLKSKIVSEIERLNKLDMQVSEMRIHRSVIHSYKKNHGMCILTVQSAIEYKVKKDNQYRMVQDRVNTELLYVYDDTKSSFSYGVSLNCKNCGAPIRELGVKSCPYCGTGVVTLVSKIWKIDDIKNV